MRLASRLASAGGWAWSRLISVPILAKIVGIGAVVAAIFGLVAVSQTRSAMSAFLYRYLLHHGWSKTRSLAADLARPASTGDHLTIDRRLRNTQARSPDIRFLIVRDADDRIVAHTFDDAVPADLVHAPSVPAARASAIEILDTEEGQVFSFVEPILAGRGGSLQMGVSDAVVVRETRAMTRAILAGVLVCCAVGLGLAFLLTQAVTRPVRHLVRAAGEIRDGRFTVRARVFSDDEIGHLARIFNEMAANLERYRGEVEERERDRLTLLERIVDAQEEERKRIARELHDQLGHSLLALLLDVRPCCAAALPDGPCDELENKVRDLIDQVRGIAWAMRPSILDDYGFEAAIARLVDEVKRSSGLVIDFHCSEPDTLRRLPGRVEVALYRIAQEALSNVVRHAAAQRVSVLVLERPEHLVLLVEDDGCGFGPDVRGASAQGGVGLLGMRERAALVGASCVVESEPGVGTTVRVQVDSPGDGRSSRQPNGTLGFARDEPGGEEGVPAPSATDAPA